MGGRAGGGARGAAGGGAGGGSNLQAKLAARYASMSEKERYKATQDLANEISGWANADRGFVQGGSNGDWQAQDLHKYLSAVETKGGFAADVAKSVKGTIRWGSGPQGSTVASMSSKQAWVLAKAGVQHAIPTFGNTHIQHVQKMKVTSKWGGKTKTKKLVTWTEI